MTSYETLTQEHPENMLHWQNWIDVLMQTANDAGSTESVKTLSRAQASRVAAQARAYLDALIEQPHASNPIIALQWAGTLLLRAGDSAQALPYFERLVELQPYEHNAHRNLALVYEILGLLADSEKHLIAAIAYGAPPSVKENLAILYKTQNKVTESIVTYQSLQKDLPNHKAYLYEEGEMHLLAGNYKTGFALAEHRWAYHRMGEPELSKPQWTGQEDLQGKTIHVFCDQGIGDSVQLLRYIPLLVHKGARVYLTIRSNLIQLCLDMKCIAHLFIEEDTLIIYPDDIDYMVAMGSLPAVFGTTLQTIPSDFPYLWAPTDKKAAYRTRLSRFSGKKVGLVWSGNPEQKTDYRRSMPFTVLHPFLQDLPGVHFFNLQKFPRPSDQLALKNSNVIDWSDEWQDYADTAALIDELDLVISTCTSTVHVAGALGKPLWVLLSYSADWRWLLNRTGSPWYPSARLWRQTEAGNWDTVLGEVRQQLLRLTSAP